MLLKSCRVYCPLLVFLGFSALSGCTLGPRQISWGRPQYNEVIQRTFGEEMLLNLVRLKYRQAPEFLTVAGVAAQYTFDGAASGSASLRDGASTPFGISAGIGRTEKPTITYVPLQDATFQRGLLSPISLESLILVTQTGWRADRASLLAVKNMNGVVNALSAGGPTPDLKPDFETFVHVSRLIRELQQQGLFEIASELKILPPKLGIKQELVTGSDLVAAQKAGYEFIPDEKRGGLGLATKKQVLVMRFHPNVLHSPDTSETLGQIRKTLRLDPDTLSYELKPGREGQFKDALEAKRATITITTRSILEMMYYLSQGIEIPVDHMERGLVTVTRHADGRLFDWTEMTGDLLKVQVAKHRPKSASVAVPFMGFWYYIHEADLNSKSTFNLLLELFNIEVRGGGGSNLPVLTLGVGG